MAPSTTRKLMEPIEPEEWPDGTMQKINNLVWEAQELLADMDETDSASIRATMPKLMPMLLPGRSWDEIKATLDTKAMQKIIAKASGHYDEAMKAMEKALGNAAGATAPASPPATPETTSSPALPEATAVPCGTS